MARSRSRSYDSSSDDDDDTTTNTTNTATFPTTALSTVTTIIINTYRQRLPKREKMNTRMVDGATRSPNEGPQATA